MAGTCVVIIRAAALIRVIAPPSSLGVLLNYLQNRQRESGGFARARLSGGNNVSTGQNQRNGLGLNGGGIGKAKGCNPGKYLLV